MAGLKTTPTDVSVAAFLKTVTPERRHSDARTLNTMMARASGEKGRMWGSSIVGYGQYHYKKVSGREGDFMLTGFSPRKQRLSIYIMPGFKLFSVKLKSLGKHNISKGSCLYINKLDDVDLVVLEEIVTDSVAWMRDKYSVVP